MTKSDILLKLARRAGVALCEYESNYANTIVHQDDMISKKLVDSIALIR